MELSTLAVPTLMVITQPTTALSITSIELRIEILTYSERFFEFVVQISIRTKNSPPPPECGDFVNDHCAGIVSSSALALLTDQI